MRLHNFLIITAVTLLSGIGIASAWTGPTATPPGNNASAPLNVSSVTQSKNGQLAVDSLNVFGNTLLGGSAGSNAYLNFGATAGTGGYGIWDNDGTLNFKNSGGAWATLQDTITTLIGTNIGGGLLYVTGDTYVVPGSTANAGTAANIIIGGAGADEGLLYFDTSPVPSGATIHEAYLNIFLNTVAAAGTFNVYSCSTAWSELTVTGKTAPTCSTLVGSGSMSTADNMITVNITSAVQAWLNGSANDGLMLVASGSASGDFDSKENTTTSHLATITIW